MAAMHKALSDQTRLAILDTLRDGEKCVCEIASGLDIKQPLLSFHLKTLRDAGLVRSAKVGRWVHYSIDPAGADELIHFGEGLKQSAKTARVVHCC